MVLHARKELAQMVSNGLLIPLSFRGPSLAKLASRLQGCLSLNHAGKPCVCNNGQRDSTRNPGFTGDGKTCNTLEPCMFNKIGAQVLTCFSFQSLRLELNRWKPNGRLLTWMHDAAANRNGSGQHHRCTCVYCSACATSAQHLSKRRVLLRDGLFQYNHDFCAFLASVNNDMAYSSQLTAEITKSCDYASNQRVLQVHLPNVSTRLKHVADPCISVAAAFWGFANLKTDSTPQWCHAPPSTTLIFGHVMQTIISSKKRLKSAIFAVKRSCCLSDFVSSKCRFAAQSPMGSKPWIVCFSHHL